MQMYGNLPWPVFQLHLLLLTAAEDARVIVALWPLSSGVCRWINYVLVWPPVSGDDAYFTPWLSCGRWLCYMEGLFFKDLKQTMKKEQCEVKLLVTASECQVLPSDDITFLRVWTLPLETKCLFHSWENLLTLDWVPQRIFCWMQSEETQ